MLAEVAGASVRVVDIAVDAAGTLFIAEPSVFRIRKVANGIITALGQRIENLGVLEWEAWAQDQPSAPEIVADA